MKRTNGVELRIIPIYPGLIFGIGISCRVDIITYKLLSKNPGSMATIEIKTPHPGRNAEAADIIPQSNPSQPRRGMYFDMGCKGTHYSTTNFTDILPAATFATAQYIPDDKIPAGIIAFPLRSVVATCTS